MLLMFLPSCVGFNIHLFEDYMQLRLRLTFGRPSRLFLSLSQSHLDTGQGTINKPPLWSLRTEFLGLLPSMALTCRV